MDHHHLDDGEVFLPPEVLLNLGPKGGQTIVAVHQHMDRGVDAGTEKGCG